MNDNAPVFEHRTYHCSVSEGAPRSHFVTMVAAYDSDVSDANKLIYSIISGNDHQVFNIDATSGIITTVFFAYSQNID